jgi:hypothetical protein
MIALTPFYKDAVISCRLPVKVSIVMFMTIPRPIAGKLHSFLIYSADTEKRLSLLQLYLRLLCQDIPLPQDW